MLERHQGRSQDPQCPRCHRRSRISRNQQLVDEVEVVDERARALVKDLIIRVDTLEAMVKSLRPDPFG